MEVDLSQFTSLFEIGFALHIAVAFLERTYARELPVRIERIAARVKSLERFKREILEGAQQRERTGKNFVLQLPRRTFEDPAWVDYNDDLLDQLYNLGHESQGRLSGLKRILSGITILAVIVALYSVAVLFLIGLDVAWARNLEPMTASLIVLAQLLPLPIAAGMFFFVARRMSREVDRQLRGIGERRVVLSSSDQATISDVAMVEEIYRRDQGRSGAFDSRDW